MVPAIALFLGAIVLYAGIHDESVSDVLRGVLGKPKQGGKLSDASAIGSAGGGGAGSGNAPGSGSLTGGSSVANHPELKSGVSQVVNTVLTQFPHLTISSTVRSEPGSYHATGEACDLAAPMTSDGIAYMNQAAQWITQNLAGQLSEGIHNPGLSVKKGQIVSPAFWGPVTWAGHANHIHVARAESGVTGNP